ncbi:MAG: thioredoxin family protein [Alphaproteobacteria bacterium]|nr:thioredoxin family protein [Alphaproteobacteria bacterium]MDD9919304.1 thioredoxin family protein [Alphaproteobacteria bacterium]
MRIAISTIVLLAPLTLHAQAEKYLPCLNYWTVGMSGCNPEEVSKTAAVSQTNMLPPPVLETAGQKEVPQITQQAEPPTLDKKIDDFLESHGKPPREFVAFHLEPTLENALKWVYKYNNMLQRNVELTRAWMQAEAIYDRSVSRGEDASVLETTKSMAVPDFGVNIPNMPNLNNLNVQALPPPPAEIKKQIENTSSNNPFAATNSVRDGRIGGDSGVLEIDYYFSAECPYCQKFEPEFNQMLSGLDIPINVTCVDITPSGQHMSNILGKVDCTWRPAGQSEIQRMGIRTTPSLIIRRGEGRPLERISGYVESERLREHILKGEMSTP